MLDHTSSKNLTVTFSCGKYQPIHATCYKYEDSGGKVSKENVDYLQQPPDRGKRRSLKIPFNSRKQSGIYEVVIETLPHLPTTKVLKIPKVTKNFKVKVQGQLTY